MPTLRRVFPALLLLSLAPYFARAEAKWDEHGARCLDKPRLVDKAAVLAECDLPSCATDSSDSWEWSTHAWVPHPLGQTSSGKEPINGFIPHP